MQIKMTQRVYLTQIRMAFLETTNANNVVDKKELTLPVAM